ncbi:prepilin peptidase [Amycolatopsis suaedae]|uniref:Prepilin peptidase n=1 Tax=Amycolatopsis suaedae TaxID=2510978 RepID=A0A4Q7JDV9_9PSEU|nr:prepilin peptidase [Amycolatopsis suaedae]
MFVPLLALTGSAAGFAAARLSRAASPPAVVSECGCALVTGLCWAVFGLCAGDWWPPWWLPVPLLLTALAVPLVAADLRYRRLPNPLTLTAYPVLGVAVGAAALGGGPGLAGRALATAVLFAAAHGVVCLAAPGALGAGDVKLSGSLGGVLGAVGWTAPALAAVLAAVVTLALVGYARLRGLRGWRDGVPHGPGMLGATVLVSSAPGVMPLH